MNAKPYQRLLRQSLILLIECFKIGDNTMADTIDTAFVRQFQDEIFVLVQQEESRLMSYVRTKGITGSRMYFDRLGPVEVIKKTQRFQPTIIADAPHSRRQVAIQDYNQTLGLDKQDVIRLLIDPTGEYARALAMGMARQIDRDIIVALEGDSVAVDADLAGSIVPLPPEQIIDAGGTNFTLAKLRETKLRMDRAEVPTEGRYLAWNSSAQQSLLNEAEATSVDFNSVKVLVEGQINTYFGFEFVRLELLTGGDTAQAQMLAFHNTAVGMAVGEELDIRIDDRPDLSYAKQIFAAGTFGMIRIEEAKVVRIDCDQT